MQKRSETSPQAETPPFVAPPRRFLHTAARRGTAPAYYVRDEFRLDAHILERLPR